MDGELSLPPSLSLSIPPNCQSSGLDHEDFRILEAVSDSFLFIFSFFFFSCCSFFVKFAADTKWEMEDWIAFIRSVWDDVEQPSLEVQTISFLFSSSLEVNSFDLLLNRVVSSTRRWRALCHMD